MDFIRDALRGRRSRQHEGEPSPPPGTVPRHALDTLPTLPVPRRPLTPTPPHPQHLSSPFFKLPPEIRQQIYPLVLANREIHLDMRYTAVETQRGTPHSTRGALPIPCSQI
ncbi:hypothetical protein QBC40DRAFT_264296 [Triangularia verruculosa]|uniref:DUF7730 domain-containing protein n=1 Tax=Triangularia verruculosa TaxID=2587418 RepID=A0AAN7AXZ1_9PEZI|nr:hypothetical protein QBC40DRAFT_264296 [Triangularia verruculosa]